MVSKRYGQGGAVLISDEEEQLNKKYSLKYPRLATALLAYVEGERPAIVEPQPGRLQRGFRSVKAWARRVFSKRRLWSFLVLAFLVVGTWAVLDMALLAFLALAPTSEVTEFLRSLVAPGELAALGDKIWFTVRAILEGGAGLAVLAGGVLVAVRKEWRGLGYATVGIIVDLTAVNLMVFYQDQWKALIAILVDYILLGAAFSYRRIYLDELAEQAAIAEDLAEANLEEAIAKAAAEMGLHPGEAA